jgi:caa(3)-type oxidase subunit IV
MTEKLDQLDKTHATSKPHAQSSLRTYYIIFAWLMGLLALTVIVSLIPFDKMIPGLNVIALIIAFIKAGLVVVFFMHVKDAAS